MDFVYKAGLGLRRGLVQDLLTTERPPGFVEIAPENWMLIGGKWGKALRGISEKYSLTAHGLSLSIGSSDDLDWSFLREIKKFLLDFDIKLYSEHLSFTKCRNAHLYELLPIPFREDAVRHVVQRIKQVQNFLGRKIAIENVSYYTSVASEMDEADFIRTILEEADCYLLLDINNVYVNAFNHNYDAKEFLRKMPLKSVAGIHMAGHEKKRDDLIIDTHGQAISSPVYDLFEWVLPRISPVPVLLERDFNFRDYDNIRVELDNLNSIINRSWSRRNAA